jgi:hypothetical protein
MTEFKISNITVIFDKNFIKNESNIKLINGIIYYENCIVIEAILNIKINENNIYYIDGNKYNLQLSNLIYTNKQILENKAKELKNISKKNKNECINKIMLYRVPNDINNKLLNTRLKKLFDKFPTNLDMKYFFPTNTFMNYHCWLVSEKNSNNLFYCIMLKKNFIYVSQNIINHIKNQNWQTNGQLNVSTTTDIDGEYKYLHKIIMEKLYPNTDLKIYTHIKHLNENFLDNRNENLKYITISKNNTIEDKKKRRSDAKPLPQGISESDLPKYTYYKTEKRNGNILEYFAIINHPKCKSWITSKGIKMTIKDKLAQLHQKLTEI